ELIQFIDQNRNYYSLLEYWQQNQNLQNEKIRNLFLSAKYEFLKGSPERAAVLYKQIVAQAYELDSAEVERQIISTSFLRLAQIETELSDEWIKKAADFAPQLPPNKEFFPPPLQDKWQVFAKEVKILPWNFAIPLDLIDKIIINGKAYEPKMLPTLKLYSKKNRVTFVSNSGFVNSISGSYQEIINHSWNFPRVAQGQCSDHQILAQNHLPTFAVLFPNQCVITRLKVNSPVDLKPEALSAQVHEDKTLDKKIVELRQPPTTSSQLWYKNKWLWIGLSVVTGYFIYKENNKPKQDAQDLHVQVRPTHERH
ncbi:MAG: hypothetical protein KDD40_12845, partial [Bdellovibrionales bacterium]|nr:hypothetical protein [Bdellovibrionales bacterium]